MLTIGLILYFAMDGVVEAMTWLLYYSNHKRVEGDQFKAYHISRWFLRVGITLATLAFTWYYLALYVLGFTLYKFVYNWVCYGNFLYNKTSTWLYWKHPKTWVWIAPFVLSLAWVVREIIRTGVLQ